MTSISICNPSSYNPKQFKSNEKDENANNYQIQKLEDEEFVQASASEDIKKMKKLIPNIPYLVIYKGFNEAIKNGKVRSVRLLLKAGVDPRPQITNCAYPPLHEAAYRWNSKIVNILCAERYIDINAVHPLFRCRAIDSAIDRLKENNNIVTEDLYNTLVILVANGAKDWEMKALTKGIGLNIIISINSTALELINERLGRVFNQVFGFTPICRDVSNLIVSYYTPQNVTHLKEFISRSNVKTS